MCDDNEDCCPRIMGYQGMEGFQGATSVRGFQGDVGYQSDIVVQGTQGAQGAIGTGLVGNNGAIGLQGPAFVGDSGVQGPQGLDNIGPQGLPGDIGAQGVQGSDAFGVQGLQGFSNVGSQGTRGIQGFQGLLQIGPQGPLGTISGPKNTFTFSANNVTLGFAGGDTLKFVSGATFPGYAGGAEYTVIFDASLQYPGSGSYTFQLNGFPCTQIIDAGSPGSFLFASLSSKQTFSSGTQYLGPTLMASVSGVVTLDYVLQIIEK